uniref:Reverse transcriptase domain-containing protein n=1 Tax=Tanacetum cinerariifolium TaxID=118510 RepID=A0A699IGA3_TANCI|nr:reverse transcriptase domain-containing protein [Tanacetum cinerariifolium]
MADTRTMSKLLQAPTEGYGDAIVIPAILAENFELKVGLLQLVTSSQFHGFERDDPYAHIHWFNKITSTLKYKNFPYNTIKLMLFLFSLEGATRIWLEKEPPRSIHTWEDLVSKFFNYFFPPSKTTNLKNDIMNFQQRFDETFTAGGNLLKRTPRDALTIIVNKSKVRISRNKPVVSKVNTTSSSSPSPDITALTEIIKELVLMNKATQQATVKAIEETCGGPHPYYECLVTGGNTFDACAAVGTYNQGGNGYRPQGDPNYHASNQMRPPGFPPPNVQNSHNYNHNQYNQNQENYQAPNNQGFNQQRGFADALLRIPKFASTFKSLFNNKEKLFELANTLLTENYSAVLLKKLPEKLGDPRRFLIPCDFHGLESCMALADLGASINLIPLSVWKKLSVHDLTPTRMTLELATSSIAYPTGISEDVFVQVGKFTFPADFVIVDYDVDPRVPLILGRPFLRKTRALVDVHEEELILRNDELIFHADSTPKHTHKHRNESINTINFIDITCEDHFPEVLKFKKSNHPLSGSATPLSDSSSSLTPFETSDSLLKEFADELALLDLFPPRNEDDNFDLEVDLRKIKYFLNQNPSSESNVEIIDPILKKFIDEPALDYLHPSGDDDDDLFDLKSDNDEWKKILYGDCYKDIDSEKDKTRTKMKLLVVEDHIVESNDLLPQLLDNDSTLPEESSEIATLSSSPFENKDKVFNPGILILRRT